jgi:hypothetical protein
LQIAAICRKLGATLATRNTGGFEGTGIELLDPWGLAMSGHRRAADRLPFEDASFDSVISVDRPVATTN